jgi:hypothetical protein
MIDYSENLIGIIGEDKFVRKPPIWWRSHARQQLSMIDEFFSDTQDV